MQANIEIYRKDYDIYIYVCVYVRSMSRIQPGKLVRVANMPFSM